MANHSINEVTEVTCDKGYVYKVDKININGKPLDNAQMIYNENTKTLDISYDETFNKAMSGTQTKMNLEG